MSVAKRAATMLKMIRLANMPGMDGVAIKLNCEPTYDEIREAERWQRALELAADENKPLMDLAIELAGERRRAA